MIFFLLKKIIYLFIENIDSPVARYYYLRTIFAFFLFLTRRTNMKLTPFTFPQATEMTEQNKTFVIKWKTNVELNTSLRKIKKDATKVSYYLGFLSRSLKESEVKYRDSMLLENIIFPCD